MAYTIRLYDTYVNGSGYKITVPDGDIDYSALSIPLVGEDVGIYAGSISESLTWQLENFAGVNAPDNALRGQLWFDTAEGLIKANINESGFDANWQTIAQLAPQGAEGPIGPQGIDGEVGETGPIGAQGPTGNIGTEAGPAGPIGSTGAKGSTGDTGATGDTGTTGSPGPAGESQPMIFVVPSAPSGGNTGKIGDIWIHR